MRKNKVVLTTVLIGLLSGASVFAQHQGGTSGPDNSTYANTNPLATNDTVLTHADLETIVRDCMTLEGLRITRLLAKTNDLVPLPLSSGYTYTKLTAPTAENAQQGENGSINFNLGMSYAHSPSSNPWDATIGFYDGGGSGNPTIIVDLAGSNQPFQNLSLRVDAITFPRLSWKETALPDAVDEYGRVKLDKVIVTGLQWKNNSAIIPRSPDDKLNGVQQPIDLNHSYAFYNCASSYAYTDVTDPACHVVKGVEFDMQSFSSCINSKTGIH